MRSNLRQKSTTRTNTSIQHSFAIVIIILAITASLLIGAYDTQIQFVKAIRPPWPAVSMASSNNNLYIAWMSNDTGHWNVFFAKSVDGGKTFSKSIILNVLNTGNTINANTHISASGNNVYVTWWTNQKASSDLVFSPSFRASNDNGSTFGNIVVLNKNGSATVAPGAGASIVTSNVPPTIVGSPTASVGNNVYIAWPSNSTGHWNVFFAKSEDGGKTFKAFILSSPNTGKVVDFGTNIVASGNDVYVNWWTNKPGRFEPVFRASNDNGTTFGNIIRLNSTSGGVSK